MDLETLKILKKGFPKHLIKKRKGLGGFYDFVTGNSVQDRLDEAFNGDWSWDVDPQFGYKIGKEWVYVVGVLSTADVNGRILRKSGEGAVQVKKNQHGKPLDLGFDISAASTKALKKAATRFGIAREIEVIEPNDEGSVDVPKLNPTSTGQRGVPKEVPLGADWSVKQPKQSHKNVFPDDNPPAPSSVPMNIGDDSGDRATPVQVEYIKTRVRTSDISMIEAIRRGLDREDVPDQPEHLTKEEAKKVLIILNR